MENKINVLSAFETDIKNLIKNLEAEIAGDDFDEEEKEIKNDALYTLNLMKIIFFEHSDEMTDAELRIAISKIKKVRKIIDNRFYYQVSQDE